MRIKKNDIMDANDPLFEYIKIPLGHNRTYGAVYSKIIEYSTSKLRSTQHKYSIVISCFFTYR